MKKEKRNYNCAVSEKSVVWHRTSQAFSGIGSSSIQFAEIQKECSNEKECFALDLMPRCPMRNE